MKINEEVLDVWIKILKKVKNSKIILKSSLYICEDVIKKRFEKEGLSNSLELLKKTKIDLNYLSSSIILFKRKRNALRRIKPWASA